MIYQIVLALHIISIISWMAGILYLIRIQINAKENGYENKDIYLLLKGMMQRLYKYITFPAMIASVLFGSIMIYLNPALLNFGWFWIKLICALCVIVSTLVSKKLIHKYENQIELPSSKSLRYFNEVPTLAMIVLVFMVILKPSF